MKISQVAANYAWLEQYLHCPLCQKPLHLAAQGSFLCENRHCFDLSKKGYLNLLPALGGRAMKYQRTLFESRRRIFQAGFYQPVVELLQQMIKAYCQNLSSILCLDAGCGEGYYAHALSHFHPKNHLQMIAIDYVKEAILLAAQYHDETAWLVGDLTKIPLQDEKITVLLNILSPANYQEFSRVLTKDGIFIKIIPGTSYLQEIRQSLKGRLQQNEYSNADVIQHFTERMCLLEQRPIFYQQDITLEEWQDFLRMTPMTFGVGDQQLKMPNSGKITIALECLVGKKKR